MSDLCYLSANRSDEQWLDALRRHLAPYRSRGITPWDARDVPAGDRVREACMRALEQARVAVLLVSTQFLAEEFLVGSEFRTALTAAVNRGLRLVWIPIGHSAYEVTELCEYQPLLDARRPLDTLDEAEQAKAMATICERLHGLLEPEVSAPDLPQFRRLEEVYAAESVADGSGPNQAYQRLTRTLAERDALREQGLDTAAVDVKVLQLRRELRHGLPLRPGDSLADENYLLLRPIGSGGFATVWLAQQRLERSRVAIKVLNMQEPWDPERRDRFLRGTRAMMELRHEHIVRVLDPHGDDSGHLYCVMEYIDGITLHEAVVGGLTPEDAIPQLLKIGDALAHAHARGIIHSDVKPLNILLDRLQRPYLTDFDLTRVRDTSGTHGAFGTFTYTAPELADEASSADVRADARVDARVDVRVDARVDVRVDVYGLGMTAVFVLAGKSPEVTRDETKGIDALPYSAALRGVLKTATASRPEDRFANMNAFCRALASAWDDGAARQPG